MECTTAPVLTVLPDGSMTVVLVVVSALEGGRGREGGRRERERGREGGRERERGREGGGRVNFHLAIYIILHLTSV